MKWIVLSLLTFIFWVGLYLYIYLGFSKPVEVSLTTSPEMVMIYKEHFGAYHKINSVIVEVEKWLGEKGIQCEATFGEYLDDPNEVAEDRLKSYGGCIFETGEEKLSQLEFPEFIKFKVSPVKKAIKASFEGSPAIGPFRVYPKINEMIQDQRLVRDGGSIEVYVVQGSQMATTYYQPVQEVN